MSFYKKNTELNSQFFNTFCEFNSVYYSEPMKYYRSMKHGKIFFISVFWLLAGMAFSQDVKTPEQDYIHIQQCVSNKDNSLTLVNTVYEADQWRSVVYAITSRGMYDNPPVRTLWSKSTSGSSVRNIVFSPYSDKFYFFCSWKDDNNECQGLYTVSQIKNDNVVTPDLSYQNTDSGIGYLIVNKKGVWLLKDICAWQKYPNDVFRNSELYQVENEKGEFVFKIPSATKDKPFHGFYNMQYPKRKVLNVEKKHWYEQSFQNTDYTLLILDEDETSWWVFNCITQELSKHDNYLLAKKAADMTDHAFIAKQKFLARLPLFVLLFIILAMFAAALIIALKRLRVGQKSISRIERNKMIFDIQEKERAKISRDIHDSVVQDIRVLRLETENLVVDEASKARQTKIADLATDCIIKLRNICYNLAPAELASHNEGDSSKLELISIINSLVQQFSSRTHIPCVFKVEEGFEYPVLEKEKTQNLFRVIQEALTNVEKHSYATQASIFMKKDGKLLLIYVTDDGIGCNPDELAKKLKSKEHLGLRSMKDRMELINGTIEFFTNQNDGMEIKIELPLDNAETGGSV